MLDAIDMARLAIGLICGILLGALFFGGLWWSVQRLPQSHHPMSAYFTSLAVRMAVAFFTFYFVVSYYGVPQLIACLVGFVVARSALARFTLRLEPQTEKPT